MACRGVLFAITERTGQSLCHAKSHQSSCARFSLASISQGQFLFTSTDWVVLPSVRFADRCQPQQFSAGADGETASVSGAFPLSSELNEIGWRTAI